MTKHYNCKVTVTDPITNTIWAISAKDSEPFQERIVALEQNGHHYYSEFYFDVNNITVNMFTTKTRAHFFDPYFVTVNSPKHLDSTERVETIYTTELAGLEDDFLGFREVDNLKFLKLVARKKKELEDVLD